MGMQDLEALSRLEYKCFALLGSRCLQLLANLR